MGIILISTTVGQDYIKDRESQNIQDKRDSYQRKIYDSSLLHMKLKFDTSNQKLISIVSNVLGNYGYKLDSQNLALKKLEISVVGKEITAPVLSITPPRFTHYFEGDTTWPVINLKITSKEAASSYFDISVYKFYGDGNYLPNYASYEYVPFGEKAGLMEYTKRLSKNETHSVRYYLMFNKRFKVCYLWIKGEYRRIDGSGIFKIDDMLYFDRRERKGGVVNDEIRKEIVRELKF